MRARAGDPPRTMPQKVLAGRAADTSLQQDLVQVRVDQVILTHTPSRALTEALSIGLKKTPVEVAIVYDGMCITDRVQAAASASVHAEALGHGLLMARPGTGFAGPVHLERFAAPARLAVTDDPRMCLVGGIGMLALVVAPGQLGQALAQGTVHVRPPRSIQVLLSGRLRPFVGARDVALELLRRGLAEAVKKLDARYEAPVVLEFAGPSARLLSVPERAVLCALAPTAGAASALFVSDEKSEVFLRDQRRSKAHRVLNPDAGAPCDEVLSIDLGSVDPMVMDERGQVHPVRDLQGEPVAQVVLGGDSGVTLRDLLSAATLLKSKRVPSKLDLLVAPPSRQILEVLAQTGALMDLVATGARILEPDRRLISGALYAPASGSVSLRTFEPDPAAGSDVRQWVASAETIAYTVAQGALGDPRAFKRPVRVTVPRAFPTEDVLIVRQRKTETTAGKKPATAQSAPAAQWLERAALRIQRAAQSGGQPAQAARVLSTDTEVRQAANDALTCNSLPRVVITTAIPSFISSLLAGVGTAAFVIVPELLDKLPEGAELVVPPPSDWSDDGAVTCTVGGEPLLLHWTGKALERRWLIAGTARPSPSAAKTKA